MEKYLNQLLSDISQAAKNAKFSFSTTELNIHEWISDDDDEVW